MGRPGEASSGKRSILGEIASIRRRHPAAAERFTGLSKGFRLTVFADMRYVDRVFILGPPAHDRRAPRVALRPLASVLAPSNAGPLHASLAVDEQRIGVAFCTSAADDLIVSCS